MRVCVCVCVLMLPSVWLCARVWSGRAFQPVAFSSCLLKCSSICVTFDKLFGRNVLQCDQTNEGGKITLGRATGHVVK